MNQSTRREIAERAEQADEETEKWANFHLLTDVDPPVTVNGPTKTDLEPPTLPEGKVRTDRVIGGRN